MGISCVQISLQQSWGQVMTLEHCRMTCPANSRLGMTYNADLVYAPEHDAEAEHVDLGVRSHAQYELRRCIADCRSTDQTNLSATAATTDLAHCGALALQHQRECNREHLSAIQRGQLERCMQWGARDSHKCRWSGPRTPAPPPS
jgi:hypothetical protein